MADLDFDAAWLRSQSLVRWRKAPADVLSLSATEMDFRLPRGVAAAVTDAAAIPASLYPDEHGSLELRTRLADFQSRRHDIDVTPDDITITPGARVGLFAALRCLTPPGRAIVIVGQPVYGMIADAARAASTRAVTVPFTAEGAIPGNLAELVAGERPAVVVVVNPHSPTGRVLARSDVETVVSAAEALDAVVVTDEVHEHLVLDGRHCPIYAAGGGWTPHCLAVSGFGKTFNMPGYRLGYLIHRGPLIRRIERVGAHHLFTTSTLSQAAGCGAMAEASSWLSDLHHVLRENRARAIAILRDLPGLAIAHPAATYFLWVGLPAGVTAQAVADALLARARVAVDVGDRYGSSWHLRISFATDRAILDEALERIATCWPAIVRDLSPGPAGHGIA